MERECNGGVGMRRGRIWVYEGIFIELEERVWRKRERVSKSSRVEEAGARREDNGGVCTGV